MKTLLFITLYSFLLIGCNSKTNSSPKKENVQEEEQLDEASLQNLFYRTNDDTLKFYYRKSECGEWGGSSYILRIWEDNQLLTGNFDYYKADCDQIERDPLREILPTKNDQLEVDKELEQICISYIKELMNTQFQPSSGFHAENLFAVKLDDRINLFSNGGTKELHLIAQKLIERLPLK